MTAKQDRRPYQLIDLYALLYGEKYGKKPVLNKYQLRWGFLDMIESIGYDESVEVIKHYFGIARPNHTTGWLFNNFDNLYGEIESIREDRERRRRIRERTERLVRERENE